MISHSLIIIIIIIIIISSSSSSSSSSSRICETDFVHLLQVPNILLKSATPLEQDLRKIRSGGRLYCERKQNG